MRQTDGSQLLGTNDPRGSEIGIIHVAPNDDRQSVLAAILTQDKLGAKQTVVVLPEENKAFQRPVDFEGLKNMRRGLKTQIVFVAPPGRGPAEFARQRRFPVYSSLESYGQSLKRGNPTPVSSQKGGWLFGRRQKTTDASVMASQPSTDIAREQTVPLNGTSTNWAKPEQVSPQEPSQIADEQRDTDHIGEAALGGAGFAAGALAAHDAQNRMPYRSEDWDALPPAGTTSQVVNGLPQEMSPQPVNSEPQTGTPTDTGGSPEAGIGTFPPPRPRNSGKVPVPPIAPVPTEEQGVSLTNVPVRRRNTGKRTAIPAAAMGAGAGAAMFGSTAGGGTSPPGAGGVSGGGTGRSRRRRNILLALLVLLLATLLCLTGFAFAAPNRMNPLSSIVPGAGPPSATVTITPKSSDQKNIYGITAVTGKPDPTKRQVQARLLSSTITKSDSTNATGTGQTPGVPAKGMLTFYNGKTQPQTVAANTIFTDPLDKRIQVMNVVMAPIPAANPPTEGSVTVAAQAVNVGAIGNTIKAGDIFQTCCTGDKTITVTNLSAFSGGQDPQTFSVVLQADIDRIANPLKTSTLNSAKQAVKSQVQANEQLVSDPQCSTNVTSDHNAGDRATKVSVTVTAMCSGEVYDLRGPQGAQALATNLLKSDVAKNPNLANYVLTGSIVTTVTQTTVNSNKTISLFVKAEGIWVYQFTDASKAALAKLIAGKSKSDAETLLANAAGVDKVDSIDISGGGSALPSDPKQITIVVLGVPGLQGTPTVPPGPTATPTSQQGLGGS